MNDLIVPFVIHWDGEPEPDLAGIDDPVRVPFRFVRHVMRTADVDPGSREPSQVRPQELAQAWLPLLLEEPPIVVRPPLPKFPSSSSEPPGPGWVWRGKSGSKPGDSEGAWYNEDTKESLHPNMDHSEPIGPHWDYRTPGKGDFYRWFPDGRFEPSAS